MRKLPRAPHWLSHVRPWLESRHAPALLFLVLIVFGIALHGDYGVPWDEQYQRPYGLATYSYVLEGNESLLTHGERYHGPVFEFVLIALEKLLGLADTRSIYAMRHFATFLLFAGGIASFFAIARRWFKKRSFALLTAAFLLLSPRIAAEAFYNTKDIAFLALFIVAVHTLVLLFAERKAQWALLHGLFCGLLIDVRILGIILLPLSAFLLVLDCITHRKRWKESVFLLLLFLLSLLFFTGFFWPSLWEDPTGTFLGALEQMRKFPWNQTVFYFGEYIAASSLPWHYIPTWIGITTPPILLFLGALGSLATAFDLFHPRSSHFDRSFAIIVLYWLIAPFVIVFFFRPVLYDGWRHLYFLAPVIALLAGKGFLLCVRSVKRLPSSWRPFSLLGIRGIVALSLLWTAVWVVQHHPFEHLYFSPVIGGLQGANGRFELDYWGLSYRRALEELLQIDHRPRIRISVENDPGRLNVDMLRPEERARIEITPREQADYHLTNHRWHYGEKRDGEVLSVEVDGVKIATVYDVKK